MRDIDKTNKPYERMIESIRCWNVETMASLDFLSHLKEPIIVLETFIGSVSSVSGIIKMHHLISAPVSFDLFYSGPIKIIVFILWLQTL